MHLALPFILLNLVVLQQTIYVMSLESPSQSPDNDVGRPNVAQRLRAPLMGRSLVSLPNTEHGTINLKNMESNGSNSASDDEQFVVLNKRRYGAPLFGRRWINTKRRGPLFG
ncbi:hypothetical protein I4U23_008802 [Adineta vaga]|nr:hypothetical protein I4U23_008802 [Adineta vaga]